MIAAAAAVATASACGDGAHYRLPQQLLPVVVMSSVPRGTKCDFGGTGADKRKGCSLPRKQAARASRSEAVLEATGTSTRPAAII